MAVKRFNRVPDDAVVAPEGRVWNRLTGAVEQLDRLHAVPPLEVVDVPGGKLIRTAPATDLPTPHYVGEVLQCVQAEPFKVAFDFLKASIIP